MARHKRFNLKNTDDLRNELTRLGLTLPLSNDTSLLADPLKTKSFTLANRFVSQPMEGTDAHEADGRPSDLTFRRYSRFASGGAALIWFEAVVVRPDGRSNPRQLMITKKNLDTWKRLIEKTRAAAHENYGRGIVTAVQLTHSGRWSKPEGRPAPLPIHYNPLLDKASSVTPDVPLLTDDEMERLREDFENTAKLAYQAGFDGVEMKAVHGYITGEMLCAHRRPGKYGGSYENRTRFVRDLTASAYALKPAGRFVTARLTVHEPSPFPYGWGVKPENGSKEIDLTEPLRFAKELSESAEMPVFNFSIGYPRFAPYMNRPFDNPVSGAPVPPEHPLEGIVRFQNISRELKKTIAPVPVVTAALAWLRFLMPSVAAGLVREGWTDLIGQGRQSFAYPESVRDILTSGNMDPKKCCLTCSLCSQIMKDGVGRNGCPVRDKAIYASELRKGRARRRED